MAKVAYTSHNSRKLKERLLPDNEVFSNTELDEMKVRRRKAMFAHDTRLRKEQQEFKRLGTCPICNLMLTTEGRCPGGLH